MILDKVENVQQYNGLSDLLKEGLKFIAENDFSQIEPGKFFLKDDLLFATVSEYATKPASECKLEAHRKYIDIQYIVSGEEKIGFTTFEGQTPSVPYNPEKDIVFFKEEVTFLTLTSGTFAIFFPSDLHQPCVAVESPSNVKKVVVKVAVR
jgi:YhcH/YjgK/YiaL family protein